MRKLLLFILIFFIFNNVVIGQARFVGSLDSTSFGSANTETQNPWNSKPYGYTPISLTYGDLNNDGKVEKLMSGTGAGGSGNTGWGLILIGFNTTSSVSGNITYNNSFNLQASTNVSSPQSIKLSDLDGDGKVDIIFVNKTNNVVSIFPNNYVTGQTLTATSFNTRIDYATGTTPVSLGVDDIDGDGKKDLVVTNSGSNTISIFLNTSTSGSISFAAKIDVPLLQSPYGVKISDLDNDSKKDIILTYNANNSIALLRNTSSSGSITFATPLVISTQTNPKSIETSDLDLDGKPDIIVAGNTSNLDIFRNLLTIGGQDFTSSTQFAKTTINGNSAYATSSIAIADLDGNGYPDIGTFSTNISNPSALGGIISFYKNTTSSSTISFSRFDYSDVDYTGGDINLIDLNADKTPDLAYVHNLRGQAIYRINFPNPNITSFTNNICPNTAVTITGYHFEPVTSVKVGGEAVAFTINSGNSISFTPTASNTGVITVVSPWGTISTAASLSLNPSSPTPTTTGTTVCYGSAAVLTAAISGSYTLTWYANASGGSSLGTGVNFTTPSLITTTNYYVESSSGCGASTRAVATATVVQSVGGTASANQVICSGTSPTALILSGNTGTIQWYASTDNITFSSISNATNSSYTPGALTATTYYKAGSSNSPCGIAYSSVVKIQVGFTATLTKVDPNCETPGSMTASSVVSPGGDTNLFYSLDNTTWQSSNVFNNIMNNNYSIYIKSNSCPTSSNVGSITLSGPTASTIVLTANAPSTYSNNVYNGYDAVGITASGGSSYVWSGGASTNSASNSFKYSGSYSLTMTNASGCTSVSSIQVSVKVKGLDMYGNSTEDSTIQLTPYGDINRSYAVDQYGIIHDTKTGKDGSSSLKAAISGLQLAHDYPSYSSGWYWIKSANMPNALQMYVDMTEDGGGYDFYFVTGGPSVTNVVSDKNGGTDLGLDLVMPRSKYHWRAMSNAVIAGIAIGSTKVGSGTYESFFQTAYGIYRSSNTGNAGSNSYTNYVMRSSYYGGTNNAADWKVKDGGRWWLRDTVHGEPNGDYTLNTVLGLLLWNSASFPNPYALGDLNFNDQTTGYSTGNFYLVSTNVKQ